MPSPSSEVSRVVALRPAGKDESPSWSAVGSVALRVLADLDRLRPKDSTGSQSEYRPKAA